LVPIYLAILTLLLVGVALAVSVLNVVYRDVAYLVNTGLMLFYWLTPIIYSIEDPRFKAIYRNILMFNPVGAVLMAIRRAVMEGRAPALITWAGMLAPTALVLLIGWLIFRHYERMVLDYV
jgi:ABC-2 type transport system permease protein